MHDDNITARYYNESSQAKQLADLPFYLRFVQKQRGKALDVGCGTGRMTLPIARKGFQVVALDSSAPMLRVLRGKLRAEPNQVRSRVTVRKADMRRFRTRKRFSAIIVPFRALQHLHQLEDQVAALTSLRRLLAPEGRLAFDVFCPKWDRIISGVGQEVEEMSWSIVEAGKKLTMRRFFLKETVDSLNPSFSGRFIYRTFRGAKLVREQSDFLKMTCYTYNQLQLLFQVSELESMAEYGTFSQDPLRPDSPEMIFVLRRKGA